MASLEQEVAYRVKSHDLETGSSHLSYHTFGTLGEARKCALDILKYSVVPKERVEIFAGSGGCIVDDKFGRLVETHYRREVVNRSAKVLSEINDALEYARQEECRREGRPLKTSDFCVIVDRPTFTEMMRESGRTAFGLAEDIGYRLSGSLVTVMDNKDEGRYLIARVVKRG